jgi:hypothetical protein
MDFWIAFHKTRWVEGEIALYLFLYPPFLKGGLGGFRKRLKIPLNPPLQRGTSKRQLRRIFSRLVTSLRIAQFRSYLFSAYDSPNKQNGVVEKNLAGKLLLLTLAPSDII